MNNRPLLKIQLSRIDKIFEAASYFWLFTLWILTATVYNYLPETIPTHFDGSGQADDHGSKMALFFLPVIGTLCFIGLSILNHFPHIFNYPAEITTENAGAQYTNATRMIRYMKLSMMFILSVLVFMIYKSSISGSGNLGAWFLPVVLCFIFLPLGYFTMKAMKGK